jgi:predicted negative regulator of RcsB-dependent stress response
LNAAGVHRVRHIPASSGWVLVVTVALSGCLHYNVIRNADRLYVDAEAARRAGLESTAADGYRLVVTKTGAALRSRPDSEWADRATLLLGRARLRLGELREARAALTTVSSSATDPALRSEADVYLAVLSAEIGDRAHALALVNDVMDVHGSADVLPEAALAEAHLLRGRLLLEQGRNDQGWWDLDRAIDADPLVRVEAGVERLRWAVTGRSEERTRDAVEALLRNPDAGVRGDTVVALVRTAGDAWGADVAAHLLEYSDESTWSRGARGQLSLERARLLHEAGDTVAAADQAARVASGLGSTAAEGRLLLADWRSARAQDLSELYSLRVLLLPAGTDPVVADRLDAIDALEALVETGLSDPLGWFAAAEVARDRLGADYVARGLFLAYADGAPDDPWAPKALLAALEASANEGDRAWLRGRLEAHAESPYVLAARGGPSAGFQELEEELELRLKDLANP